jgi:hypothetical protein
MSDTRKINITYEELVAQLPEAEHVHVDETGWKMNRMVFGNPLPHIPPG